MLKNYFLTAWRNLLRNRFYSLLNITGLAIGLCVGLMILLWVQDELSYDRFHKRGDDIYKINSHIGSGNDEQIWETAPAPLLNMSKKIPEIEDGLRTAEYYQNILIQYGNKKITPKRKIYADPSFFTMLDFRLIKGDKNHPFESSHSVVITDNLAKILFGDDDPIGKVIVADKSESFEITGVVDNFPQNSSIQADMIFPMSLNAERFDGNGEWKTIDDDLGNYFYNIYFLLKEGANPDEVASKLSNVYESTRNFELTGKSFSMQRLIDLHLIASNGNTSALQTVRIFILVAIFTLIIGCINYVNLSTARSIVRCKEVSMRKIIGANRKQLFIQFLFESTLLFVVSSFVAFGLIRLLLPLYNEVSSKQLVFSLYDVNVWLLLASTVGGSLAIASIYPALLLSSFHPIEALKGKIVRGVGKSGFRKALVVTQFIFSVVLIVATIVVSLQLRYIHEKDLGYNKEHIFQFQMRPEMEAHSAVVRNELMKKKGVNEVSFAMQNFLGGLPNTGDTYWEGKAENRTFVIAICGIDEHFIPLFNIKMLEGRAFRAKSDSAFCILNEAAVREMGIKDPVGKNFKLWDHSLTIAGVVKDFHFTSLKQPIKPAIFFYQPANSSVFVKTTGKDAASAISGARNVWASYSPDQAFEYTFMDESYDRLYKSEQRTSTLFNVFAIVAITISCLGLLGLATYTAHVKKREVGIRKVLGATVSNITGMLAKDFVKLVIISLLVALPIAWYAMNRWLEDFAYRIQLSWWIFAAAGIIALLIAVLTVSVQAIRAAIANPVNSLKEM